MVSRYAGADSPRFVNGVLGGLVPVPLANPTPHDRSTDGLQPLHGVWDTLGRPVVVAERDRLSAIRNSAASMEFLVVAVPAVIAYIVSYARLRKQ